MKLEGGSKMFNSRLIRQAALLTLFFFTVFVFSSDLNLTNEKEDDLIKARKLFQEGDFDGSIKMLNHYIEKLKSVETQKEKKAEAFYLLAKIYFMLGEDMKTVANLRKVFETYPGFVKAEINIRFKQLVEKIRKTLQVKKPVEPRVIERPSEKKKKKKSPILLVVGGIALVTVLTILLLKKKKEEEYDIRGDWTLTENAQSEIYTYRITFNGSKTSGTLTNYDVETIFEANGTGTYTIKDGKYVSWRYDGYDNVVFSGNFINNDYMQGTVTMHYNSGVRESVRWSAARGYPGGITGPSSGIKAK